MSLINCGSNKSNSNNIPTISVDELKQKFDNGDEFYLLDVRTQPEYEAGHLAFANGLIPYDSLSNYLDQLPRDRETTIYSFCRSGRRSGISTVYLRSVGYKNAYNVTGGIIAWTDAGFETVGGK